MKNLTPIQKEFILLTETESKTSLAWKYLLLKKKYQQEAALSHWLDELADYNRDYANTDHNDELNEMFSRDMERRAHRDYIATRSKVAREIKEIDEIMTIVSEEKRKEQQ